MCIRDSRHTVQQFGNCTQRADNTGVQANGVGQIDHDEGGQECIHPVSYTHLIMEVTIPPEWMDRTIGEINIRKKYNINILALKKDGKLDMNITPDTQLCRDESMLVLGKYASIQKCFRCV